MDCSYVEGAAPVCPLGQAVWGECPNHFYCYAPCAPAEEGTWVAADGSFYNNLASGGCEADVSVRSSVFMHAHAGRHSLWAAVAPSESTYREANAPSNRPPTALQPQAYCERFCANGQAAALADGNATAAAVAAAGGCEFLAMVGKSQVRCGV
jgi:hypothetical protein